MNNFNMKFYLALFLRRLPVMMALLLICSGVALVTALKLPPTYSTSARLLVEAPQIPDTMVASTVRTDATEQLQVIEQQLMTRANLIDIANKWRVFPNMREMSPDKVVERMHESTSIRRSSGRGQATLMTVSFEAGDGQTAANVVNDYVTLILETNSEIRMERAENTLNFFEQEVERLGGDLDRQSARIVSFKSANAEALPDDLVYRQNRQALLQERLGRLERDRASLINQRSEMIAIFEATGRLNPLNGQARQATPEEQQLANLQSELEQALTIYSEANPRVVLLRNRIAKLEERVLAAATPSEEEKTAAASRSATILDVTLAEMDQRLKDMDAEIADTATELKRLEETISATAANAIALDGLHREYQNIEAQHTAAVNNLNQARMSERIEVTSQGERISVIENANVPQEPSGPDRPKIAAMGIGAGLGLAAGFFVLLELINRTIRRPAELQARFGIVPIATIPYMETARERFARRAMLLAAFVAVLIAVPAALYYVDTQYMPLEILTNKIINRLGLA